MWGEMKEQKFAYLLISVHETNDFTLCAIHNTIAEKRANGKQ